MASIWQLLSCLVHSMMLYRGTGVSVESFSQGSDSSVPIPSLPDGERDYGHYNSNNYRDSDQDRKLYATLPNGKTLT